VRSLCFFFSFFLLNNTQFHIFLKKKKKKRFCTFSVLGWDGKLGILVLLGSIWLSVFCNSILDFGTLFEFVIIFLRVRR
jgi:hypothetical protein